jgi:hypothetical protein
VRAYKRVRRTLPQGEIPRKAVAVITIPARELVSARYDAAHFITKKNVT